MEKYGRLTDNGIEYFHEQVLNYIDEEGSSVMIFAPKERHFNRAGWYRIEDIKDDGVDTLEDNVIKCYVGTPRIYEPTEEEKKINELNNLLADDSKLQEALERLIAANGVTEEDKAMAQERIDARYQLDELGKIKQTSEGTGDEFDPIKYWQEGTAVEKGKWYQCYDAEGYIWEAIKDGIPSSDTDKEYFDVVGV